MAYEAKNYEHLLGLTGFSDALLTNHFGLYNGYVANTNTVAEKISTTEIGTPEYAELSRRFGWEFNGMRLHELYFDAMNAQTSELRGDDALAVQISKDFGSVSAWEKDFIAKGSLRGIGWTVLYYDTVGERLFNVWINEHDMGHLAGAVPLLIMDVFEHAFVLDYGMDRKAYIEAFMQAIDWSVVCGRFAT